MKKNKQIKGVFLRVKRYLFFIMQYLFYEKPHGLDFSMRDTRLIEESDGKYYGYSKSSEAHIHDIFQRLSYEDARLLDVGCGKGVVLKEALKFPFQKIAGIEIRHKLVETAKRNFKIMGGAEILTKEILHDGLKDYDTCILQIAARKSN